MRGRPHSSVQSVLRTPSSKSMGSTVGMVVGLEPGGSDNEFEAANRGERETEDDCCDRGQEM